MNESKSIVTAASSQDPAFDAVVHQLMELMERLESGDVVDVESYVRQYPEHAEQLRNLWPTLQALAQFEHSVAGRPSFAAPVRDASRPAGVYAGDRLHR